MNKEKTKFVGTYTNKASQKKNIISFPNNWAKHIIDDTFYCLRAEYKINGIHYGVESEVKVLEFTYLDSFEHIEEEDFYKIYSFTLTTGNQTTVREEARQGFEWQKCEFIGHGSYFIIRLVNINS